jgi:hypothetical protein
MHSERASLTYSTNRRATDLKYTRNAI